MRSCDVQAGGRSKRDGRAFRWCRLRRERPRSSCNMAPALACVRPVLLSRRAPEQRARTAAQRAQKLTHGASRAAAPFALAAKRAPARRVAPHAGGTVCAAVAAASADDNAKEAQAWIDNWRASRAGAGGASVADRVKAFFGGAKLDRNKLAALGTSALLAYGANARASALRCAPAYACG